MRRHVWLNPDRVNTSTWTHRRLVAVVKPSLRRRVNTTDQISLQHERALCAQTETWPMPSCWADRPMWYASLLILFREI